MSFLNSVILRKVDVASSECLITEDYGFLKIMYRFPIQQMIIFYFTEVIPCIVFPYIFPYLVQYSTYWKFQCQHCARLNLVKVKKINLVKVKICFTQRLLNAFEI